MARVFVSAAHKSSGKTTVSVGIAAALRARGLVVQPFKKGPDYIDPLWLSAAAGRDCHNLDFHTMEHAEIREEFVRRSAGADLSIIEGNKGLHDGVAAGGADSNAALAKLLAAPVVLVVDTRGITRGIAPLLCGYRDFDPGVRIAGVVLNRVGGQRHEAKLVRAVQDYTDLPVLGAIGRVHGLALDAAHLGLVPPAEVAAAGGRVERIARCIEMDIDLDRVRGIAARAGTLDAAPASPRPEMPRALDVALMSPSPEMPHALDVAPTSLHPEMPHALDVAPTSLHPEMPHALDVAPTSLRPEMPHALDAAPASPRPEMPHALDVAPATSSSATPRALDAAPASPSPAAPRARDVRMAIRADAANEAPSPSAREVRIAIARDAAFCFYYPGDLEALEAAGARLVPFDTLHDRTAPQADGIFIGGGFPERAMDALEANAPMRASLRERIAGGAPIYAECGGLMYLARRIRWNGRSREMVGAIPADVAMHRRPRGRGYVVLEPTGDAPWTPRARGALHAHEFHHSSLENIESPSGRPGWCYAYLVRRGHGIDGERDGIVIGNLLASYGHLRDVEGCRWAERFVAFVRNRRDTRPRVTPPA